MKTPTKNEIDRAFAKLRESSLSAQDWVEIAHSVRFEPRLGETWLQSMSKQWTQISPLELQVKNHLAESPAVLGVLLTQLELFLISKNVRPLFQKWKSLVLFGVKPASGELFTIGLHPFASQSSLDEIIFASKSFKKWGFGGQDAFINKFAERQEKVQTNDLDRSVREQILRVLIKSNPRIRVEDYLLACGNRISRRVAQLDLAACPKLVARGESRARFYVRRKK